MARSGLQSAKSMLAQLETNKVQIDAATKAKRLKDWTQAKLQYEKEIENAEQALKERGIPIPKDK